MESDTPKTNTDPLYYTSHVQVSDLKPF